MSTADIKEILGLIGQGFAILSALGGFYAAFRKWLFKPLTAKIDALQTKLEDMDKAREEARALQAEEAEENRKVHRIVLLGQLQTIAALRQVYPNINGDVKRFEERYRQMLEDDGCDPAKKA
jgi:N-methylhydantoinase A/oxoprolinase/acetone carboxylase beta subunit